MPKATIGLPPLIAAKKAAQEKTDTSAAPVVPSMLSKKVVPVAAPAAPKAVAPPKAAPVASKAVPASKAAAPASKAAAADTPWTDTPILGEVAKESAKSPYEIQMPSTFIPSSRRGFTGFITQTFRRFMMPTKAPHIPGDKYPYQKFVREYMRQETPYRGVLVYHGLGTGKTCTSIATAEALYSTSKKKIIVMTKASLQDTFLEEITKCGFKHFRLENHWVKMPKDEATKLFAKSVLQISTTQINKQSGIWVPDFKKESNYSKLTPVEQTEIRGQISSTLIWDEEKNPEGLIRFIRYNGGTAMGLKDMILKTPDFFDNSVIVIDEVHNLVSNMHMDIDRYLLPTKGRDQKLRPPEETITIDKWLPKSDKTYTRGYMYYRILLGAKNSKIVALSGTPIINSLEELGILVNILHGYIPTLTFPYKGDEKTLSNNTHFDYVKVDKGQAVCTLLPEGFLKDGDGIKRVEEPADTETIIKGISETFGSPTISMKEVLPPFGEQFREKFVNELTNTLKNKLVLVRRLSGVISYYRGGSEKLMPRIKTDEIVRVPMSAHSLKKYTEIRGEEIVKEKRPMKKSDENNKPLTSNYKMASRQACNFTFPDSVIRPRPSNRRDELEEAVGNDTEILELDKQQMEREGADAPAAAPAPAAPDAPDAPAAAPAKSKFVFNPKKGGGDEAESKEDIDAEDCKTGQKPGEKYNPDTLNRIKGCLERFASKSMMLGSEDGLKLHSPKYVEMLQRIATAPGSSLVYSQFLSMEGIGIFEIAMKLNGYDAIELTSDGNSLTPNSLASLENKEKDGKRFIRFSGGEDPIIRKTLMNLFNANYSKLPSNIQEAVKRFPNNHKGELCRVFSITSAGAEGLSLKCVRAVHVMEPYWNDVRLTQVKGRAVRINSHMELPVDQRDVSIYTYISVFPEGQKLDESLKGADALAEEDVQLATESLKISNTKEYTLTSDERLFLIAQRKKFLIDACQCLIKAAAVDCQLMHKENNESYECAIENGVGGFLSHPDVDTDIVETKAAYPTQDTEMFASCDTIKPSEVKAAAVSKLSAPAGLQAFSQKK